MFDALASLTGGGSLVPNASASAQSRTDFSSGAIHVGGLNLGNESPKSISNRDVFYGGLVLLSVGVIYKAVTS